MFLTYQTMPKYYFTPAGNRQIALSLQNTACEDFNFQQDHRSEDPTDLIFIPHLSAAENSPEDFYAKSRFLAMLIGGSFNISRHDRAESLAVSLDWLIDWEKEERIPVQHTERILPLNPYQEIAEEFDMDKAIALRKQDFVAYAIYVSKFNRFVCSLLLLASQKHSFISLYAMLDTIEASIVDPTITERKAAKARRQQKLDFLLAEAELSEDDINAFTGTANNFGLLGLQSRHGDLGWGQPKNTVDLDTATKQILRLAYNMIYTSIDIDKSVSAT